MTHPAAGPRALACLFPIALLGPVEARGVMQPAAPVRTDTVLRPAAAFPTPFSHVRGLRELPDGRVLVTDWIEERLVLLDLAAGTGRDLGRVGRGPSEFRLPGALIPLAADSTLLLDVGNSRLTVIGPDLRFHRTIMPQPDGARYSITPRSADAEGWLYYTIPGWAQGPNAPATDSLDVARWHPATEQVEMVGRILGAPRRQTPSRDPSIPFVAFAPADGWGVAPDGRVAFVRAAPYRVEWRETDGRRRVGPPVSHPSLPVTEEDRRTFLLEFLTNSPLGGRGNEGLTHTPGEWTTPDAIARMVRSSEFAEVRPPIVSSAVWVTADGVWALRSLPADSLPTLDLFDTQGIRRLTIRLPRTRRVVGIGGNGIYAVSVDKADLQRLERYPRPLVR